MEEASKPTAEPVFTDNLVTTKHKINCGGKEINYTATTGTLILREEITETEGEKKDQYQGDKARAEIFFVAYTKDDMADPNRRPLTFSFNGGPGSASVWVHLGFLGPMRVKLTEDGAPFPPPAKLVENEYSILDMTDLVFIDPVGTGYSRAVKGDKPKDFWGWKKDIESVGEFIRLYVTRNQRWSSPKYIAGESYGTTRATGIADYLSEKHGLYLNGIMLISTALDFSTLDFYPGNELPFVLFLPTYAADAWYHHKLSPQNQACKLPEFLDEVRAFAAGPYLSALFRGNALSPKEKETIAAKTAAYTGLTKQYLLQTNLRINIDRFCKELLRDQRQVIGRIDSRYIGYDQDAAGEVPEDDPSCYELEGAYSSAINDYVNRELGYKTDRPYIASSNLWEKWSYKEFENQFLQLQNTLRKVMVRNRFMKVWVLNGYFDLATPFFASEYVFSHLNLEPAFEKNLRLTYYESGHMIYLHQPSLQQFRKDAESFYREDAE